MVAMHACPRLALYAKSAPGEAWLSESTGSLRRAQDDTPVPTNRAVYLLDTPSATFFVSQYGGFGQDDITVSLKVAPRL